MAGLVRLHYRTTITKKKPALVQQLINHKLYNLKNALEQYVNFKQIYWLHIYGKLQRYRDNMKIKVGLYSHTAHSCSYSQTYIQLAKAKALRIYGKKKLMFFMRAVYV